MRQPFRLLAVAAGFAVLAVLLPRPAVCADASSPREQVYEAADQYAKSLIENPPDDLGRGEIAAAFGWIYLNNMLGGSSEARAIPFLETALAEGLPEAGVILGAIHLKQVDVPGHERNAEAGIASLEQAATGGSIDACRLLGVLYSDGDAGIEVDEEKGRRYLLEAARRGSDSAIQRITPLLGQHDIPASIDEVVVPELVEEAQERSNRIVSATARVFDLLEKRLGELELSIETSEPELPLAELSQMSPEEQAMYWEKLSQAIDAACIDIVSGQPDDKSSGDAALVIGVLHHLGFLYGSEPAKAREFMEYALKRGVIESRVTLGELCLDLTLQKNNLAQRDVAKGLEHLTIASDADCVDAQRLLGLLYEEGAEDIEPDADKAREYYLKAARHGDAMALERLKPMFDEAKTWEEEHPGEKSKLPTGPEAVIVPELAEAAQKRQQELADISEMVNRELDARIKQVMLGK